MEYGGFASRGDDKRHPRNLLLGFGDFFCVRLSARSQESDEEMLCQKFQGSFWKKGVIVTTSFQIVTNYEVVK